LSDQVRLAGDRMDLTGIGVDWWELVGWGWWMVGVGGSWKILVVIKCGAGAKLSKCRPGGMVW